MDFLNEIQRNTGGQGRFPGSTGKKEKAAPAEDCFPFSTEKEPITELVSRGNSFPFSATAFQEKYLNIFTTYRISILIYHCCINLESGVRASVLNLRTMITAAGGKTNHRQVVPRKAMNLSVKNCLMALYS